MLKKWNNIQNRYDAIKNHKRENIKKRKERDEVKELGNILASAYLIDPHKADQMWQYIIELNTSSNTGNSEFYITRVYYKMREYMRAENTTVFLMMNQERFQMMIEYGLDSNNLFDYSNILRR